MKIRVMIAVCAAKFVGYVCKKMGRQGVTWAGKVAIKICPDILEQLSSQVRKAIFVTCGTNGKTTTNNMLCAALEAEGQKVICNHTGSNMLNGVVAAFVLASKWNGKIDADYACIEADEASTRHIFPRIKPDYMLLTNLFRDQLDRYGEIDITMNILEEMMRKVPKMQIIVNGDDALSAYLAMDSGNPYVTYGISKPVIKSAANEIREGRFCKRCGEKLEYRFYHYSQLGDYYCPKCGFARPKPDFDAEDVKVGDQLSFCVEGKHIVANYKGFYNVYNILAAYAGVRDTSYRPKAYSFMEKQIRQGRQVYVICPMVEESEGMDGENVLDYTLKLRNVFSPDIKIASLHGKMKAKEKNVIMEAFAAGEIQILVSTTVVEVGVNVPNATVMMVENAERFGLAQLHQLRGRVGRGEYQSYCIFMQGNGAKEISKRLQILNKSNDGFYIAGEDLKLRGPGDLFGIRQSGLLEFKLGDIYQDADILKAASETASEILSLDGDLSLPQNEELQRRLSAYMKEDLQNLGL